MVAVGLMMTRMIPEYEPADVTDADAGGIRPHVETEPGTDKRRQDVEDGEVDLTCVRYGDSYTTSRAVLTDD